MIFRLDGRLEETLALVPVVRAWKELAGGTVLIDTLFPEVFRDNPFVDEIVQPNSRVDDVMADFNRTAWQTYLRPVCETFMQYILGKHKPLCWQSRLYGTDADRVEAKKLVPEGKVALVAMRVVPNRLLERLGKQGYLVKYLTSDGLPIHVFQAAIERASLFVGEDGDDTAVAMTTDVPAVVCYTWRSPVYFAPFRRGIPFEAVSPTKDDCLSADGCLMSNGLYESRTYGVKCSFPEMKCRNTLDAERIMQAVERIEAKT